MGTLDGIRIVELTTVILGPLGHANAGQHGRRHRQGRNPGWGYHT